MKGMNNQLGPIVLSISLILAFFTGCGERYPQGKALYDAQCAWCHMSDGTGLEGIYPSLVDREDLRQQLWRIPCAIRYGVYDSLRVGDDTFSLVMMGFPELTDAEVSNISNYIALSFLKLQEGPYNERAVVEMLKRCRSREDTFRLLKSKLQSQ